MEKPNVLSIDQVEHLMKAMRENNIRLLRYQGMELEQNPGGAIRQLQRAIIGGEKEESGPEVVKTPKKREPSDDELLLNPYAGLES